MAFITNASGNVISFAEYTDLLQKDQRFLESNQVKIPEESGFTDKTDFLEDMCQKATDRILLKLKASTWWQSYNAYIGTPISDLNVLPNVDPDKIDPGNTLSRRQQFTDLCVYYTFKEYLFPLVAEFGNEESPEVAKIQYYNQKFNDLFNELISIADWYDADGDGTVEDSEKAVSYFRKRRTRSRSSIVQVR